MAMVRSDPAKAPDLPINGARATLAHVRGGQSQLWATIASRWAGRGHSHRHRASSRCIVSPPRFAASIWRLQSSLRPGHVPAIGASMRSKRWIGVVPKTSLSKAKRKQTLAGRPRTTRRRCSPITELSADGPATKGGWGACDVPVPPDGDSPGDLQKGPSDSGPTDGRTPGASDGARTTGRKENDDRRCRGGRTNGWRWTGLARWPKRRSSTYLISPYVDCGVEGNCLQR